VTSHGLRKPIELGASDVPQEWKIPLTDSESIRQDMNKVVPARGDRGPNIFEAVKVGGYVHVNKRCSQN